jgi:hypothetical protein
MRNDFNTLLTYAAIAVALVGFSFPAAAGAGIDAPDTPATTFHGLPGNNPGFGGSSANPNGEGVNGGNGIHGIDDTPGQDGTNPNDDGVAGFANELDSVHAGIGAANPNVGKEMP